MAGLPRFTVFAFIGSAILGVAPRPLFKVPETSFYLWRLRRGIETRVSSYIDSQEKAPPGKQGFKETEEHCGLLVLILLAGFLLTAALLSALSGLLGLLARVLLLATLLAALVLLAHVVPFL